ncbi:hypothetical protein H2202_008658 [Exophiala xenobiotica]|nr:hypothetical protein H2202_008658 [Exophiala xenobiotica]
MTAENPGDTHAGGQRPSLRIKLVMPDIERQQQQNSHAQIRHTIEFESSHSPERPSYSPVTPTLSHTDLATHDDSQRDLPQWMGERPEPLPVSLDDNPDAIALRSALSVLQLQRQRALQDMRDLDKMKKAALEDPEQFVKDLAGGKLTRPAPAEFHVAEDDESETETTAGQSSKFGSFPSPQNVFRCPPIEWAKYHIVGEPLDRMHEVQQHHPGYTEEMNDGPDRPQPHVVAAPYRPFVDKLDRGRSPKKP